MTEPPAHRRAEDPPVPASRTVTPAAPQPAPPAAETEKPGRRPPQPQLKED